jgi:argininosuccinate lyase
VQGSLAHIKMLESIGLLSTDEWMILAAELRIFIQKSIQENFLLKKV